LTLAVTSPTPASGNAQARQRQADPAANDDAFGETLTRVTHTRRAAARDEVAENTTEPAAEEGGPDDVKEPASETETEAKDLVDTPAVSMDPAITPVQTNANLPGADEAGRSKSISIAARSDTKNVPAANTQDVQPVAAEGEPASPSQPAETPAPAASPPATASAASTGRQAAIEMLMGLAGPRQRISDRPEPAMRRSEETDAPKESALPDGTSLEETDSSGEPGSRMRSTLSEFALRYGSRGSGDRQPMASPDGSAAAIQTVTAGSGQAQAAPAAQPSTTAAQLAADLAASLSGKEAVASANAARDGQSFTQPQGIQSLRLQLQPIELGTVTIDLAASGEQMDVEIKVETEEAHQRLSSDADEIVKTLRALGFDVDRVQLTFNTVHNAAAQAGREQPQMRFGADGQASGQDGRPGRSGQGSSMRGEADAQDRAGAGGVYI